MKSAAGIILFIILLLAPLNHARAENLDSDNDGIPDEQETLIYHTNPNNPDTDGDGFPDGEEIKSGYSPLTKEKKLLREVDTDHDGLWDDWEIALGTDPTNPDTDGDGFPDGMEVMNGHDPLSSSPEVIAKRIEVNLASQTLSYFFGDKKLDEFAISSGLPGTPTPTGTFAVIMKRPVVDYKGPNYDFPHTKWNLMFKRGVGLNYYIHGAYWHRQFGKRKSHGCVNVPYLESYMGRLYDWADIGTHISIT